MRKKGVFHKIITAFAEIFTCALLEKAVNQYYSSDEKEGKVNFEIIIFYKKGNHIWCNYKLTFFKTPQLTDMASEWHPNKMKK